MKTVSVINAVYYQGKQCGYTVSVSANGQTRRKGVNIEQMQKMMKNPEYQCTNMVLLQDGRIVPKKNFGTQSNGKCKKYYIYQLDNPELVYKGGKKIYGIENILEVLRRDYVGGIEESYDDFDTDMIADMIEELFYIQKSMDAVSKITDSVQISKNGVIRAREIMDNTIVNGRKFKNAYIYFNEDIMHKIEKAIPRRTWELLNDLNYYFYLLEIQEGFEDFVAYSDDTVAIVLDK